MTERVEKHDGFEEVWGVEDNGIYYEQWATHSDGSRDYLIRRDVTTIAEAISLVVGAEGKIEAEMGGELMLLFPNGQTITIVVSPT